MHNTNTQFVAKLAKKSYRSNRRRNYISILATLLTSFMIMSVFSVGSSYIESYMLQQQQVLGTTGNATLNGVTDEQLEYLRSIEEVKSIGLRQDVIQAGSVKAVEDDFGLYYGFRYYDQEEWVKHRLPVLENVVGGYPVKEEDIMLPLWYLKKAGIKEPRLGTEFAFEYSIEGERQQKVFRLSGYFDEYDNVVKDGSVVYALVSDSFGKLIKDRTAGINVLADMTFTSNIEKDRLEAIESGLNLKEGKSLRMNPDYKSGIYKNVMLLLGTIVLSIMLSGYLFISNIFNMSVMNEIYYYGQLKTIGVSKKQIKRMLILQGCRVYRIGAVSGVLLGAVFSRVMVPIAISVLLGYQGGVVVHISSWVLLGTLLFTGLTLYVALLKPATIAGKVEPVDALHYESKLYSRKKKKRHKPTVARMAYQNVLRDFKRFISVVVSLTLGIIITLLVTVFVSGMNSDNYVEQNMESDIELKNKTTALGYGDAMEQVFSEKLIEQLRDVDGVGTLSMIRQQVIAPIFDEKVLGDYVREEMKGIDHVATSYFDKNPQVFYSQLIGMEIQESVRKQNPQIDWDAFDKGDICLIPKINDDKIGKEMAYKIAEYNASKSGVEITEQREVIKIGGTLPEAFNNYGIARTVAPHLIVSPAYMNRVVKDGIITNIRINMEKDAPQKTVNHVIKEIINGDSNNRNIIVVSSYDKKQGLQETKLTLYTMGGSLAFLLGIIGIMNFINVLITSVNERRKEFTIMESIGVSRNQLIKMVQLEGFFYLGAASLMVSTVGNVIIGIGYKYFVSIVEYAKFSYPMVLVIGIFAVLLGISYCMPIILLKARFRVPLIERMETRQGEKQWY